MNNNTFFLSRKAKKNLRQKSTKKLPSGPDSLLMEKMHELQLHQIELEMQNEELRETQQLLEAMRDKYAALYEIAPVGYLTLDNNGLIMEANLTIAAMLGVERVSLINQPLAIFIALEDRDNFYFHYRQIGQTTNSQACELKMVKRHGGQFYARLESIAVCDRKGTVIQGRVVVSDITDRKQAESKGQAAIHRLHTIIDIVGEGITLSNEVGYFEIFNSKMEELTGYTKEEANSHHNFLAVLHPDPQEYQKALSGIYEMSRVGGTRNIETIMSAKDGTIKTLLVSTSVIRDENHTWFWSAYHDITKRKQMEMELKRRTRELILLNNAGRAFYSFLDVDKVLSEALKAVHDLLTVDNEMAWLIDPLDKDLVCQDAWGNGHELILGLRLPAGIGIAGWTVAHNESVIVLDTRTDNRYYKGVDEKRGYELRSLLCVPLRAKGEVIGVLEVGDKNPKRFTSVDQTLLELLASSAAIAIEKARLYEQAQRDAKTKTVLLNEVNHRVKNNLTAIIGLLYVEKNHSGVNSQTAYQSVMDDLITRVDGLSTVHSMLSASEWAPLQLSDLTEHIINSALQARPSDKWVYVKVCPSAVRVNSRQANDLALVINELTTNTMKYAMKERDSATITVSIRFNDGMVYFEFCDDGPGYPPETLQLDHYNVGMYLIQTIVHDGLRGEVVFFNNLGAVTQISFKV